MGADPRGPAPHEQDGLAPRLEAALSQAKEALLEIIVRQFPTLYELVEPEDISSEVFTLKDLKVPGSYPNIRLEIVPLPKGQTARTFCNTISDNHVIQLSDRVSSEELPDAISLEVAALAAQRRRAQVSAVSRFQMTQAKHQPSLEEATDQIGERARLPQRFRYPMPGRHDDGRLINRAELPEAVRRAAHARDIRSRETLADLRREAAQLPQGVYPRLPIVIGAGAAVAARDPARLLIDTRQRWHIDPSRGLVQAADQVSQLREIGMGDPYQFAAPRDRLPLAALRLWEHTLALNGPLIDGLASLVIDDRSRLVVQIRPADGSAPVMIEVEGEPLIATGIAPQALPGCSPRVPSVHDAFEAISRHLVATPWPVAPLWAQILAELPDREGTAQTVVDGLDDAGLLTLLEDSGTPGTRDALQTLRATAAWDRCRAVAPGKVLLGDEVSDGRFDPSIAETWMVAGKGGGGNTAPEIILESNPDARVIQLGGRVPEVLLSNAQYRELQRRHNREFGGDGRLTIDPDARVGTITMSEGPGGQPIFEALGHKADAYVACLGRTPRLPRVLNAVCRAASAVRGDMMFDSDRQYLGYHLTIRARSSTYGFEITGAASRILPPGIFTPEDIRLVEQINLQDAPAESGNVAAGFLSTAMQAVRLEAHRARSFQRDLAGARAGAVPAALDFPFASVPPRRTPGSDRPFASVPGLAPGQRAAKAKTPLFPG
ncbi:hypothetical protein AB0C84_45195 [Actinomadura sp. NPDC048955]|uniref:hypothetical protein n=1 Tax=Actinomadura sp. NPDC048955 TaxID=3158228 RepID=UPI0033E09742